MLEILNNPIFIYFSSTGVVGILLLIAIPKIIHNFEQQRLKKLTKHSKRTQILGSPASRREARAKTTENLENSIEGRFSIIRKLFTLTFLIIWIFVMAIPFLGSVPITIISVIISAAGIIIGIAARPFLENVIAGIMLSFSQLLKLGDTVMIDNYYGTIEDISISHTIVKVWDWKRYVIPNSLMLQKDFINFSLFDRYVWAQVTFNVSYDTDIESLEEEILKIANQCDNLLDTEPPRFWTMELNKESIECWVVAWTASPADAWFLKTELRNRIIRKLKELRIQTHVTNMNIADSKFHNSTKQNDEPSY
ncbi:MAG: mechanosensitive ion channel family protein [Spirochaetia bacterium]